MRLFTFWLLALLPLVAGTPKPVNIASYTLAGHTFRTTSVKIYSDAGEPGSQDEITVQVGGTPPFGPGEGAFLLTYRKPVGTPTSSYRATQISYSYSMYGTIYNAAYTTEMSGQLTTTAKGAYSGSFQGTCTGEHMDTHERSTVVGTFTNVLNIAPERH
jgi:hypothetical protein